MANQQLQETVEGAQTLDPVAADSPGAAAGLDHGILVLIQALDTEDHHEQRRVSRELIAAGRAAVPALVQALAGGTPPIRKAAAYLLSANHGDAEIAAALCRGVIGDPEAKVRQNAAVSLGKVGTPGEVSGLARALAQEEVGYVRRSVILALGALGGEVAHAVLRDTVPRDETEHETLRLALDRALPHRQSVTWRAVAPWSLTLGLEVPPGLEAVAREEAAEHGVAPLALVRPGLLRCPPGFPPGKLLPTLRCAYSLLIDAGKGPPLPLDQPAEAAHRVTDLISASPELSSWREWLIAEEDSLRYRFSVEHPPIQRELFQGLLRAVREAGRPMGLFDSPSNYDVELILHTDAAGSTLSIRPSFMKDTRFLYRRKDVGASIHPVVAACLVRLSRASTNGTVFDPTCGSATLLIERALLDPGIRLIGQDISRTALAAARTNVAAAGLAKRITLRRGDSTQLESWPRCDELLANLPFGMRTRRGEMDLPALYHAILANLAARLLPGGRAVLYTANRKEFERGLSPHRDRLHLEKQVRVLAGGLWVQVWVLGLAKRRT